MTINNWVVLMIKRIDKKKLQEKLKAIEENAKEKDPEKLETVLKKEELSRDESDFLSTQASKFLLKHKNYHAIFFSEEYKEYPQHVFFNFKGKVNYKQMIQYVTDELISRWTNDSRKEKFDTETYFKLLDVVSKANMQHLISLDVFDLTKKFPASIDKNLGQYGILDALNNPGMIGHCVIDFERDGKDSKFTLRSVVNEQYILQVKNKSLQNIAKELLIGKNEFGFNKLSNLSYSYQEKIGEGLFVSLENGILFYSLPEHKKLHYQTLKHCTQKIPIIPAVRHLNIDDSGVFYANKVLNIFTDQTMKLNTPLLYFQNLAEIQTNK